MTMYGNLVSPGAPHVDTPRVCVTHTSQDALEPKSGAGSTKKKVCGLKPNKLSPPLNNSNNNNNNNKKKKKKKKKDGINTNLDSAPSAKSA